MFAYVEKDDFLLVIKAFHRKVIPIAERNLCAKHVSESNQLSEQDSFINECLVQDPPIYKPFNMDCLKLATVGMDEDEISDIQLFKQELESVPSPRALTWCGHLLIDFHESNECSEYFNSALKFYLETQCMIATSVPNGENIVKHAAFHLKCSVVYNINGDGVLHGLQVFNTQHVVSLDCSCLASLLNEILKITNETKIDVLSVWEQSSLKSYFNLYYNSLVKNIENFAVLIKFGKTDYLSQEKYMYFHPKMFSMLTKEGKKHCPVSRRSQQIFHLYFSRGSQRNKEIIKALENSTGDPFLTETEFRNSFSSNIDTKNVSEVWSWYEDYILEGEIPPTTMNQKVTGKSPRSLQHLTRCSIRRQMAACLQLPSGVESLLIPLQLKKYILLSE